MLRVRTKYFAYVIFVRKVAVENILRQNLKVIVDNKSSISATHSKVME